MALKTQYEQGTDQYYGYRDAISGIYDKWYRYHRTDDGEAYNEGWDQAVQDGYVDDIEDITILAG